MRCCDLGAKEARSAIRFFPKAAPHNPRCPEDISLDTREEVEYMTSYLPSNVGLHVDERWNP